MHSRIFALRFTPESTPEYAAKLTKFTIEQPTPPTFDALTETSFMEGRECLPETMDYVKNITDKDDVKYELKRLLHYLYLGDVDEEEFSIDRHDGALSISINADCFKNFLEADITDLQNEIDAISFNDTGNNVASSLYWASQYCSGDDTGFYIMNTTGASSIAGSSLDTALIWVAEQFELLKRIKKAIGTMPTKLTYRVEGILDYHS